MLAAGTNALLTVEGTLELRHVRVWIDRAKENGFVLERYLVRRRGGVDYEDTHLIHPCIGEE